MHISKKVKKMENVVSSVRKHSSALAKLVKHAKITSASFTACAKVCIKQNTTTVNYLFRRNTLPKSWWA